MTEAIDRLNRALEGRYALEKELGEGGMATVYLADDLRHERKVAIKVLKPELAAVVGADRFLAEIKTTASLQHPHILPLHDSGEADGFLFFVMPYIDGETLRDRLDREKQLPVDEAVGIATAIASALSAAHEQGIVHRDMKPANILLSRGEPLVADFGIALAVSEAGGSRLTETGLSVGTPFYMSPEQATGDREIGVQSDVYALGCVLYEMLVGEPPYVGNTAQAVLGRILTEKPRAPTTSRPAIPANVDGAVLKALEKLPADRFTSATGLVRALTDSGFRYGEREEAGVGAGTAAHDGFWKPLALGSTVAAIALGGLAFGGLLTSEARPVMRVALTPPAGVSLVTDQGVNFAISPDGSEVVFVGSSGTGEELWLRRLDQLEATKLAGTVSARNPRYSPDGSRIAFTSALALKVVSLGGAPPQTLVSGSVPSGGGGLAWGHDGHIYYRDLGGVFRIPEGGGAPEQMTVEPEGLTHSWLDALPNGRGLLLSETVSNTPSSTVVSVLDLETGEVGELVQGTMARYVRSGHLVYTTADRTLLAVPFDQETLGLAGTSRSVLGGVQVNVGSASYFDVSPAGELVYLVGTVQAAVLPTWLDEDGRTEPLVGDFPVGDYTRPSISPDGSSVAWTFTAGGSGSSTTIWIHDLETGTFNPLTFEGNDLSPFWSPDGSQVGFTSGRELPLQLWVRNADFSGEARKLGVQAAMGVWAPDDSGLVHANSAGGTLRYTPFEGGVLAGDRTLDLADAGITPSLSPDGRWVAFSSVIDGQPEVFVISIEGSGGRRQVSVGGGMRPKWSRGGGELFYRDPLQVWWVATVRTDPDFAVVSRRAFAGDGTFSDEYDVSPDGSRILTVDFAAGEVGAERAPILVTNWLSELEALFAN